MELFLLKIPRRHQDLSPVTPDWTYLMSAWGKLSNVITSRFYIQLGEIPLLGLITQKIGGNTEELRWPENIASVTQSEGR